MSKHLCARIPGDVIHQLLQILSTEDLYLLWRTGDATLQHRIVQGVRTASIGNSNILNLHPTHFLLQLRHLERLIFKGIRNYNHTLPSVSLILKKLKGLALKEIEIYPLSDNFTFKPSINLKQYHPTLKSIVICRSSGHSEAMWSVEREDWKELSLWAHRANVKNVEMDCLDDSVEGKAEHDKELELSPYSGLERIEGLGTFKPHFSFSTLFPHLTSLRARDMVIVDDAFTLPASLTRLEVSSPIPLVTSDKVLRRLAIDLIFSQLPLLRHLSIQLIALNPLDLMALPLSLESLRVGTIGLELMQALKARAFPSLQALCFAFDDSINLSQFLAIVQSLPQGLTSLETVRSPKLPSPWTQQELSLLPKSLTNYDSFGNRPISPLVKLNQVLPQLRALHLPVSFNDTGDLALTMQFLLALPRTLVSLQASFAKLQQRDSHVLSLLRQFVSLRTLANICLESFFVVRDLPKSGSKHVPMFPGAQPASEILDIENKPEFWRAELPHSLFLWNDSLPYLNQDEFFKRKPTEISCRLDLGLPQQLENLIIELAPQKLQPHFNPDPADLILLANPTLTVSPSQTKTPHMVPYSIQFESPMSHVLGQLEYFQQLHSLKIFTAKPCILQIGSPTLRMPSTLRILRLMEPLMIDLSVCSAFLPPCLEELFFCTVQLSDRDFENMSRLPQLAELSISCPSRGGTSNSPILTVNPDLLKGPRHTPVCFKYLPRGLIYLTLPFATTLEIYEPKRLGLQQKTAKKKVVKKAPKPIKFPLEFDYLPRTLVRFTTTSLVPTVWNKTEKYSIWTDLLQHHNLLREEEKRAFDSQQPPTPGVADALSLS